MKLQNYCLNKILIRRKSGLAGSRCGAHDPAKGRGAETNADATGALLAQNLRVIIFGDGLRLSSID